MILQLMFIFRVYASTMTPAASAMVQVTSSNADVRISQKAIAIVMATRSMLLTFVAVSVLKTLTKMASAMMETAV